MTTSSVVPLITGRNLLKLNQFQKPLQAWVESLSQIGHEKVGIVDLHPRIFSVNPRLDILFRNVHWQQLYKKIDYRWQPASFEVYGSKKKPHPQKGLGRARQGTKQAPQYIGGGVVHGPRGPKSFYFMEPFYTRVLGLCTALTVKFHQNDLHIVQNLDLPTGDPQYLQALINERFWGPSVLFVDDSDIMPLNITSATTQSKGLTLMPTYGLNVYSMLKHNSLVITVNSLETIESKLLKFINHVQHRPGSMV